MYICSFKCLFPATESGLDVFDKVLSHVPKPSEGILTLLDWTSASPEDAAHAIIRATTRRQGELYFPEYQLLKLNGVIRAAFPELFQNSNMMLLDDIE